MASKDTQRPLTARQEKFAQAMARTCVGTTAAIEAGYAEKHADSQAARMLANPRVKARVAELAKKVADKAEVNATEVLKELLRIATCDIGEAFDDAGHLKPLKDMPKDVRRAIAGIDVEKIFEGRGDEREHVGNVVKVKFWNKVDSLVALGKHLKLFTEKVEHEHSVTVELVDLSGDEE